MSSATDVVAYLPRPLPGFEYVNRYWDRHWQMPAAKILPGECYVSNQREVIATVLGSCIAACVRDKVIGVGGMNHFMLPVQTTHGVSPRNSLVNPELCYGNWAMEFLINAILKLGGRRENLEVKLFGGGKVLASMANIDIGKRNIDFVLHYLKTEKLSLSAKDLGGEFPRKVLYFPASGVVKMRRLRTLANNVIQQRERSYMESLGKNQQTNVELF